MAQNRPNLARPATIGRRPRVSPRPAAITWQTARCEATATGWRFVLPVTERTNAIWRQWAGRTLVSKRHRADKETAPMRFGRLNPFPGNVGVRITWVRAKRQGDVDSRIKATLDLLTLIGVWHDDKQVADLRVLRVDDTADAPGMYVEVWDHDQPTRHPASRSEAE